MPRSGAGTYTIPPGTAAVSLATISSVDFNTLVDDIADALTDSLSKSGNGAATADISMGTHKITNLAAPTSANDAARLTDLTPAVLAKTANYTVLTTDINKLLTGDATSGTLTFTLPTAASAGSGFLAEFKKIDSSANTVIIDGNGSETIDGALTYTLSAQYDGVAIRCNGTAWYIVPVTKTNNATGAVLRTGVITPTTLAADANDYAPTSASSNSVWRISASAAYKITGIAALTSGTEIQLVNVGTFNITLTANDASSSAANRIDLPGGSLVLRPLDGIKLRYDGTLSLWVAIAVPYTSHPCAGGFKNLVVQATGNTAATMTADAITLEDANGFTYRAQSVSITITATAQGANGIGNGSALANATWYFAWVIYNPTTNTVAGLVDISATAPTMPSGYTFKARVGAFITDGSAHFKRSIQYGRRAQYVIGTNPTTLPTMDSGAQGSTSVPTWQAVAVAAFVPSTAGEIVVVAHSSADAVMVAPNNSYGAATSATNQPPYSYNTSTSGFVPGGFALSMVLESSNIYWAGGNASNRLQCMGWVDNI